MPLLRSLVALGARFYRHGAPTALGSSDAPNAYFNRLLNAGSGSTEYTESTERKRVEHEGCLTCWVSYSAFNPAPLAGRTPFSHANRWFPLGTRFTTG